ncbi:MAG: hypothetical protein GY870_12575 [archaeon]|nr:hypothetical protein [archaeon]
MVRNNRVGLGFNDDEHKELIERAAKAHLKLGDYIRWYLFFEKPIIQTRQTTQFTIPYMASEESIQKIKSGAKPYVDPYQQSKLDAMDEFKMSGSLGELHNSIVMQARGGRVLKPIPKGDLKSIKKQKDKRNHIANKHLEEIKQKNIDAGILNNE